ncbi:dihydroxy-acid/6-phosphogluconate dehydratase, partial [Colletotrichum godetiae]
MTSNFDAVHPAAEQDQGHHEPRYVEFPIAPNDATWEDGKPAMLYAAGVPNEEMMQRSPQVGVASVWWEGNPCNMHLLDLGKTIKEAIKKKGYIAWQYSTLGVSDGIAQGNEGMRFSLQSRELIADNIETITCAQAHDATVAIPGCDKNMPGCVMAVARHNRPSVIVYGGTVAGGYCEVLKKPIDIVTCYEAQGAYLFGTLGSWSDDKSVTPEEILSSIEKGAVPGPGACGGMYTANSLATIIETLGLSVTGSSSTPAASPIKMREAVKVADAIEVCLRRNIRPRDILTKESFENALVITMALGGSTNSVLHTLAMARAAEVPLSLEDFQRVSRKTPFIANLKPSGKYVIEDLFHVGGVPSVTKLLIAGGLINGKTLTVSGKTLEENVASWPSLPLEQDIIRPLSNPIKPAGHLVVLHGNIAPGGAVAKITGKEGLRFEGEAR